MSFPHQLAAKWESETAIINALYDGEKRFGELLELTNLSKPVLIKRLKGLKKKGKVEFVPQEETRRFTYRLIKEQLTIDDDLRKQVDANSRLVVFLLKAVANLPQLFTDAQYIEILREKMQHLLELMFMKYLTAPSKIQNEWLKKTFGASFAKDIEKIYPSIRKPLPIGAPFWDIPATKTEKQKQAIKETLLGVIQEEYEDIKQQFPESIIPNNIDDLL